MLLDTSLIEILNDVYCKHNSAKRHIDIMTENNEIRRKEWLVH